jgi:pSer/pThr/pTyr-binding forkhead associated (FHA) protein
LSLKGETVEEALLVPGRFVLGRTTDNDLQIDSKFVSRHHAQLVTSAEGSVVEDLNSTNGVYLNGKRVRRHRLSPGDVIKIGLHEITYSRYEPKPAGDLHVTETQVLTEKDFYPPDDDEADVESEDEPDGESYSSIARGS